MIRSIFVNKYLFIQIIWLQVTSLQICKYSNQVKYFLSFYLGSHNDKNSMGKKCNNQKQRFMKM
jgi:hypothetical protein